jgi:hypothetical protein
MPEDAATAKQHTLRDKSEHLVYYIGSWINNVGQETKVCLLQ